MDNGGPEFRGQHKVTFLAHRAEISSLIQKGYTLAQIRRMMPVLANMSYQTLARHANTFCLDDFSQSGQQTQMRAPAVNPVSAESTAATQTKPLHNFPNRKPVFEHDPDSVKKRDDLI